MAAVSVARFLLLAALAACAELGAGDTRTSAAMVHSAYARWTALPEQYPVEFLPSTRHFKGVVNTTKSLAVVQKWCQADKPVRGVIRVDGLGHSLMGLITCMMVSKAVPLCDPLVLPFHSAFRSHFVFVEAPAAAGAGGGSTTPGEVTAPYEYCHASSPNIWNISMYSSPAQLAAMSYWPQHLSCSELEEDPWKVLCASSRWCDGSDTATQATRPPEDFRYALCDDIAAGLSQHGKPLPSVVGITRELTARIHQEHTRRFEVAAGSVASGAVDECGFGADTLNVVLHIRRGDVRTRERPGSASMADFIAIVHHLSQLSTAAASAGEGPVPLRIVVFSEARVKGLFPAAAARPPADFAHGGSRPGVDAGAGTGSGGGNNSDPVFATHLREFPGVVFAADRATLPGGRRAYVAVEQPAQADAAAAGPLPWFFRLDGRPWDAVQCMARADVFFGSASSFSVLAALLAQGVRVLPTQTKFVRDECRRFGHFCRTELTSRATVLNWTAAHLRNLYDSRRKDAASLLRE